MHRGLLGGLGEREPLQQVVGPGPGLLAGQVQQPADHVEVLPAGELLVDRGVLAGQAYGAAQLPRLADHVVARDRRRAGVGDDQGGQAADQGGLARAVGTEDTEHGALADEEVDPVQGLRVAVVLHQPPHFDGVGILVVSRHVPHGTSRHRQRSDRPPTDGRRPAGIPEEGCRRAVSGTVRSADRSVPRIAASADRHRVSGPSGRRAPAGGTCRRPRPRRRPSPRRPWSPAGSRTA